MTICLLTIIAYLRGIRRGKGTCQLVTSNYIICFQKCGKLLPQVRKFNPFLINVPI